MSHSPINDIGRIKTILVACGTVALVFGAGMSYAFGASMSLKHGVILALLTVVCAVMPTMIDHVAKTGRRGSAIVLALLCIPFTIAEYGSHLGYTIGNRVGDVEQTSVQNARFDGAKDQVEEAKRTDAMFTKRLADLEAERKVWAAANPWATTTSADGLKAQLATADEAIRQEERRGGCGPKCLGLKKDKAGLEERIATVERGNSFATELAKLNGQIESTRRVIASAREKASTTEYKSSTVVNQTKFVGQLWTASLEPDKAALTWTQIAIGALIALVTTFLAPVCFFMAFADGAKAQAHQGATPGTLRSSVPLVSQKPAGQDVTVIERVHNHHTREDFDLTKFLAAIDSARARAA